VCILRINICNRIYNSGYAIRTLAQLYPLTFQLDEATVYILLCHFLAQEHHVRTPIRLLTDFRQIQGATCRSVAWGADGKPKQLRPR
jgi:hypothetical protein